MVLSQQVETPAYGQALFNVRLPTYAKAMEAMSPAQRAALFGMPVHVYIIHDYHVIHAEPRNLATWLGASAWGPPPEVIPTFAMHVWG